jgi:hypothetical protein
MEVLLHAGMPVVVDARRPMNGFPSTLTMDELDLRPEADVVGP